MNEVNAMPLTVRFVAVTVVLFFAVIGAMTSASIGVTGIAVTVFAVMTADIVQEEHRGHSRR